MPVLIVSFFYLKFSLPFLFTYTLNNLELQKLLHINKRNFELNADENIKCLWIQKNAGFLYLFCKFENNVHEFNKYITDL